MKAIFFCDIHDTFDGKNVNRNELLEEFVNCILKIIEKDNLDELILSFISSEKMKDLLPYIKEIKPFLKDTQIKLGYQFSESQTYKDGIIETIPFTTKMDQMRWILDQSNNVIYYADNNNINQLMANFLFKRLSPNAKIVQFIPGSKVHQSYSEYLYDSEKKHLEGLTEAMSSYVINNEKKKS